MQIGMKSQGQVESAVKIKILEQSGNHAQSMKILSKNGLRPLTYQEALANAPELIKTLKGKWFYLDGKGIKENGIYTVNEKGELAKLTGNETLDQKVRVYSGSQPLSLGVGSGDSARIYGVRFFLDGNFSPDFVAPVVVGVKIGHEVAAPKNVVNGVVVPVDKFTAAQDTVRTLAESGVVDQKLLAPLIEVFRE